MVIVTVYNDKGGVAKTATCLMLGQALASAGYNVLLIDNDRQGSLSVDSLGCSKSSPGMDQIYQGQRKIEDTLYGTHIERLFVIPPGERLKPITAELESRKVLQSSVKDVMDELRNGKVSDYFDYTIIDNPPDDTGHPKYCSMEADKIVIPVVPDEVCFSALLRTHNTLKRTFPNWENQKVYVVPTLVMQNRNLHSKYHSAIGTFVANVRRHEIEMDPSATPNTIMTDTFILNLADIPESIAAKRNLFVSRASSKAAKSGRELVLEIFDEIPKEDFNGYLDKVIEESKKANIENLLRLAKERHQKTSRSAEDIEHETARNEALNG